MVSPENLKDLRKALQELEAERVFYRLSFIVYHLSFDAVFKFHVSSLPLVISH